MFWLLKKVFKCIARDDYNAAFLRGLTVNHGSAAMAACCSPCEQRKNLTFDSKGKVEPDPSDSSATSGESR